MKIKLRKAEEVALAYFELHNPPWEQFEGVRTGDLLFGGIRFSMRVGNYMKRPMQAIIAINKFVRIRPLPPHVDKLFVLQVLDSAFPDSAWYNIHGVGCNYNKRGLGTWHPTGKTFPERAEDHEVRQFDTSIMDAAPYYNNLGKRR